MKTAIVHDQLVEFGGAERVLYALTKIFPNAEIYTSTADLNKLGNHKDLFKNSKIIESWFGKIPVLKYYYSPLRFLTPMIWESFDFSNYDLVISTTGSWMCKGIITKPQTLHISYIHHPPRYLYYYQTAINWQKYKIIKLYGLLINQFLRQYDFIASQRPDILIANSRETQRRIAKFYRRNSEIVYPPVNIPKHAKTNKSDNYYLTVSRLAKAKNIDILIQAFNKLNLKLIIVGTGKDKEYLQKLAGKTIVFAGNVSDKELESLYAKAKGFVFASQDEEFGIAPVEALGRSVPVIAYKSGGVTEYLVDKLNGLFFDKLEVDSVINQINIFENLTQKELDQMRQNARKTAEKFSFDSFKKGILNIIEKNLQT
ncbi:MAG: glycosyl transferase [Patescibacteria group bacterium]|nr:MAG: glycosyl transferase [Patescibacteria group bacterium]